MPKPPQIRKRLNPKLWGKGKAAEKPSKKIAREKVERKEKKYPKKWEEGEE